MRLVKSNVPQTKVQHVKNDILKEELMAVGEFVISFTTRKQDYERRTEDI
jgi:hypothetical protein